MNVNFFTSTYTATSTNPTNSTTEYYFQNAYSLNINGIPYTNVTINDYCSEEYPLTRTQRYLGVCDSLSSSSSCPGGYRSWIGCPSRDNFNYNAINDTYFTNRISSTDDSINFSDFNNIIASMFLIKFLRLIFLFLIGTPTCGNNDTRRVLYRFSYSSIDNTISTVNVYFLSDSSSGTSYYPRLTIQWIDTTVNVTLNTTVPRINSY